MYIYLIIGLSFYGALIAADSRDLYILTNSLTSLAENTSRITPQKTMTDELKLIKENTVGESLLTEYQLGNYKIVLIIEDILKYQADAIVNAANSGCLGGGGIDGIISSRGGKSSTQSGQYRTLYDLRYALPETAGQRCPLSEGRITRGGWLQYPYTDPKVGDHNERKQFNYVIHAVGPSCSGAINNAQKAALANTYVHTLERVDAFNKDRNDSRYVEFAAIDTSDLGESYQIKSLNFPTISTGIFGCTANETADSVVKAVYDLLLQKPHLAIKQINFVFWNPADQTKAKSDYTFYKKAFSRYLNK